MPVSEPETKIMARESAIRCSLPMKRKHGFFDLGIEWYKKEVVDESIFTLLFISLEIIVV